MSRDAGPSQNRIVELDATGRIVLGVNQVPEWIQCEWCFDTFHFKNIAHIDGPEESGIWVCGDCLTPREER